MSSRDLFVSVGARQARTSARRGVFWPLSIAAHVSAAAALVVVSLAAPGAVPLPRFATVFNVPLPPALPPEPAAVKPGAPAAHPDVVSQPGAPLEAPSVVGQEDGLERVPPSLAAIDATALGSVPGGIQSGLPLAVEPPPPPPRVIAPIHVGGDIKPPQKVRDVPPVYPVIAQRARVQGMVILEAVITEAGDVQDARVTRSIPLLDEAALAAVRQWKFTPTLLNGVPVPVVYTVTVQFRLQ